jgi:transposase
LNIYILSHTTISGEIVWELPKGNPFLPNIGLERLQEMYKTEQRAKPKIRLLCAIHRKEGKSIDDIAEQTNLKRRTVHAILHRFCSRGINAKDSIKQEGRPAFLTTKQRKNLVRQLERGPPRNKTGLWTTKEVREYIRRKYRVNYTSVHVWELLKALGFTIQKPRPRHYKHPSNEDIDRFKKKLPGWYAIIDKRAL